MLLIYVLEHPSHFVQQHKKRRTPNMSCARAVSKSSPVPLCCVPPQSHYYFQRGSMPATAPPAPPRGFGTPSHKRFRTFLASRSRSGCTPSFVATRMPLDDGPPAVQITLSKKKELILAVKAGLQPKERRAIARRFLRENGIAGTKVVVEVLKKSSAVERTMTGEEEVLKWLVCVASNGNKKRRVSRSNDSPGKRGSRGSM